MPGSVDERIVEMRIDNKNFESGAKKTISTLEKLERALKLKSDSKAIDDLERSVGKFDVSNMTNGLQKVQASFSALEVVGMRVISNLTDGVYNFVSKTIKDFTIAPIQQGWEKFGDKTTAVATLTAQGYELEKVNELMDQLNWFTDETSYNFTEMVNNIAKFTATGQDLDSSVTAMEGIALWAALSGQNAQKASMAMYQLSQAMGKGALKYDDYKSIQNASMDTQEFRHQAVAAAEACGVLKQSADDVWEVVGQGKKFAFNELFSSDALSRTQWFTSDVMMNVFNTYSKAAGFIQQYMEKHDLDTASDAMEEIESNARKLVEETEQLTGESISLDEAYKRLGYDIDEFSMKAFKAGQQARTWKDVVDSVKDAVSTGWMTTFEHLFGDAETAAGFWTDIANRFYDIFAEGGNTRNSIFEKAFGKRGKGWEQFTNRLEEAGYSLEKFGEAYDEVAKRTENPNLSQLIDEYGSLEVAFKNGAITGETFKEVLKQLTGQSYEVSEVTEKVGGNISDLRKVASKFWRGELGRGQELYDNLAEYGYDYNMTKWVASNQHWMPWLSDTEMLKLMQMFHPEWLEDFLTAAGHTEEEVAEIINLLEESDSLFLDILDDIGLLGENSGGELFRESLLNILDVIQNIQGAFRGAFTKIFGDEEVRGERLYKVISAFHDFTESIGFSEGALEGLQNVLSLVFSAFKQVGKVALGAGKVIVQIGMIVGNIIDALFVGFGKLNFDSVTGFLDSLGDAFAAAFDAAKEGLKGLMPTEEQLLNLFDAISTKYTQVKNLFKEGFTWENIKKIIPSLSSITTKIQSLWGFLQGKYPKIFEKIDEWSKHSPIGAILGSFTSGIKSIFSSLGNLKINLDGVSGAFERIGEVVSTIFGEVFGDPGEIKDQVVTFLQTIWGNVTDFLDAWTTGDYLKAIRTAGFTVLLLKIGSILSGFKQMTREMATIPTAISGFIGNAGKALLDFSMQFKAKAFLTIAEAIGILALALIGLSMVDDDKLTHVIVSMSLFIGVLALLAKNLGIIGKPLANFNFQKISLFPAFAATLFSFAAVIGSIAFSIAVISKIPGKDILKAVGVIAGLSLLMSALAFGLSFIGNSKLGNSAASALKAAASMAIMAVVIRMLIVPLAAINAIAMGEGSKIGKSLAVMSAIIGLLSAVAFGLSFLDNAKLGNSSTSVLKAAAAMTIMALAIRMLVVPLATIAAVASAENSHIWEAFGMIAALSVLLAGISVGLSFINGGAALKAAAAMALIALSINLLLPAFAALSGVMTAVVAAVPWEDLQTRLEGARNGILKLVGLSFALVVFGVAVGIIGAGILAFGAGLFLAGLGATVLAIAIAPLGGAIALFVKSLEDVDSVNYGNLIKLAVAFALIAAAVTLLVIAFSKLKKGKFSSTIDAIFRGITTKLGGAGAKVSEKIVEEFPKILQVLGSLLILTGLYIMGIIPQLTEIIVMSIITLFDSVANSVEAHRGALVDSITKIVTTAVGIFRDVFSQLFGKDSDLNFIEKALLGLGTFKIGAGLLGLPRVFGSIGKALGGEGGAGGVASKLRDLWSAIQLFTEANGGLAVLGPIAAILAGSAAFAGINIAQQEQLYDTQAFEGLSKDANGYAQALNNMHVEIERCKVDYQNLVNSGGDLTMINEELAVRQNKYNSTLKEFADILGISEDQLLEQIAAADGDATKIEALTKTEKELFDEWRKGQSEAAASTVDFASSFDALKTQAENLGVGLEGIDFSAFNPEQLSSISSVLDQLSQTGIDLEGLNLKDIFTGFDLSGLIDTSSLSGLQGEFQAVFAGVGEGGAAGIESSSGLVDAAVTTMGEGSITTARTVLQTNSPSLVFQEIGQGIPEGLALGISEGGSQAESAVSTLATSLISKFSEIFNNTEQGSPLNLDGLLSGLSVDIAAVAPQLTEASVGLGQSIAQGIERAKPEVSAAARGAGQAGVSALSGYSGRWYSMGQQMGQGFANGIRNKIGEISAAANAAAAAAERAVTFYLSISSPSRLMEKHGGYFSEGFAVGILSETGTVKSAARTMAENTVSAVEQAVTTIAGMMSEDFTPVITPVVDLDNVASAASGMDGLLGGNYSVSAAASRIGSISNNMNNLRPVQIQNGSNSEPASSVYTFNQYNTSPKSLSRIEIYRQTKNLISMQKEAASI